ncbi:unnamed protein product [Linum trigynum]|uniref:Uncharacterized protein n=1 Tax=Linum trigynum TaxID=586398 RepID=A0AAV2E5Q7_9ROSI
MGRGCCTPDAPNHWLYPIKLGLSSNYPEGNFGGNQLLDGSISLSPLYPCQTNDLHVSIVAGIHQSFLWLALLRHSSPSFGSRQACLHSNPYQKIKVGRRCYPERFPPVSFLAPYGFTRLLTHTHVRLLGPCFKMGRIGSPQADTISAQVSKHAVTVRAAFHDRDVDISTSVSKAWAWAAAIIRIGPHPESIGGPPFTVPHPTEAHRRPPPASLPKISSTH